MSRNILKLVLVTLLCSSWLLMIPADGQAENKVYSKSANPKIELFVTSW